MLDCLPSYDEWSPATQFALMLDHLQALRHHLESLEAAAGSGAKALIAAGPHLIEINSRSHEAHDLLQSLARQPQETLQGVPGSDLC